MAYNNDNLAVAIHDTDNIITEENIEECVVDYWTQRVKDFSSGSMSLTAIWEKNGLRR